MTITRENQNNEMALIKTIQDKKGIWCENFFVNKASEIPQYLNKLTNASILPSIDFSTAHRCIAQISVNYICTIEEIQNYIDTLKNYFIDCDLQFVVNFHEKSKSLVEISLLMSGVGGTGIDYTSIKWNNLHHQQNDTTDEKSFSIEAFDQNNTQDFEIPSFLRKHDVIYD